MANHHSFLLRSIAVSLLILVYVAKSTTSESLGEKFGYNAANSAKSFSSDASRVAPAALTNNFEDGRFGPWYDDSPGNVNWRIENYPASFDSIAPIPSSGVRYLRASRFPNRLSGLAVLRSEPFLASPGDRVSFKFWMRSRRSQANNLELAMLVGRNETVLVELSRFSTPSNFEWRTIDPAITIPVTSPTIVELLFYGYCGFHDEDALAIDDIVVQSNNQTTTQAPASSTVTHSSTTRTPTPSSSTSSPTPFSLAPNACNTTIFGVPSSIQSPNYPLDYTNSLDCFYFIDIGYARVSLTFTAFSTESCCDFVEVYDGWQINTTQRLLRLSGTNFNIPLTVVSNSSFMVVRFTTDGSVVNFGFDATITRASAIDCDRTINGAVDGFITSPNYPANYGINDLDCKSFISVPSGFRVLLTFVAFQTEQCCDFIEIYDGWSISSPLILRAGGSNIQNSSFVSSGTQMLVRFTTDGSVNQFLGFNATYTKTINTPGISTTSISTNFSTTFSTTTRSSTTSQSFTSPPPSTCNFTIFGAPSTIQSPNYPLDYTNNLDCFYFIDIGSAKVNLTFTTFGTEGCCDFVEVYDGWSINTAQRLLRLSGTNGNIPITVVSNSSRMVVRFTTDSSVVNFGFDATITRTGSAIDCDRTVNGSNDGFITSPNYPANYATDNLDCKSFISVPNGFRVLLTFTAFRTEQGFDFIEVYDGWSVNTNNLILRTSGSNIPLGAFVSSGTQMLVRFTTDGSVNNFLGFNATYSKTISTPGISTATASTGFPISSTTTRPQSNTPGISTSPTFSITTRPPTSSPPFTSTQPFVCGGNYNGVSGFITSPNYPAIYGFDYLDCRYLISVSNGFRVRLTFNVFGTESNYDFVEVYNGLSVNTNTIILRTSGSSIPAPIISSGNQILVRFTSDSSVNHFPGFHANYTQI